MPSENNRRLTDQEINRLLREYKATRSSKVRDRIVMQYRNLVESVARRFAGAAEPIEDLVQEGFIGLITAVDGYNADKGVKFSTYATHFIIGQIKHHLRDRGKIIKEPAWLQELNQKVSRIIESLSQELGRVPTSAEIAKLMGMAEESIAELLTTREVFKVASLDGGEQEEDAGPSYDIDRVKAALRVEFQLPVEEKVVLHTALERLKSLEQTVIQEFYYRDRNQTEIARSLGISCNYVSHILRNSTKKLRKILVTDELKEAQMEMALLQRRLDEQSRILEEQTVVDGLTRLYNRRYFDCRLDEELNRASRYDHPVAVLLVELSGHALVSRAYGTLRSEDLLRQAADLLSSCVRRVDIVTRFAAESFGLILPHTGSQVDHVSVRVGATLVEWASRERLGEGRAPLVLRLGAACCPRDAVTACDLVAAATDAMAELEAPVLLAAA